MRAVRTVFREIQKVRLYEIGHYSEILIDFVCCFIQVLDGSDLFIRDASVITSYCSLEPQEYYAFGNWSKHIF